VSVLVPILPPVAVNVAQLPLDASFETGDPRTQSHCPRGVTRAALASFTTNRGRHSRGAAPAEMLPT
jgi:hypothetical protein